MSVVFDEEQRIFDKDREIAATRNPNLVVGKQYRRASTGQNIMMVFFAALCILIGAAVWMMRPSSEPIAPIYREEANGETMRLIPERDREEFMKSLPVIQN